MFKDLFTLSGRWGRLNRLRYFGYTLMAILITVAIVLVGFASTMMGNSSEAIGTGSLVYLVFLVVGNLLAIWTTICLGIKRLHDLDKSGWLLLVSLVPIINFFFGLYLLFAPGTQGQNQHGPDPLAAQ